jgi:osmotically-inducible protein OsmY
MQKIRKSVVDDNSLSTYAHNVKIVSKNGKVTLKGPVRSEEEKRTVEQKAADVTGAGNVTNELTIKPEKSKSGDASRGKS